jgi:hypothetical protein
MQNCEGRLDNIQTQNTNEDGALPEIEREAYEKGNMTFRNWEDNLKNNPTDTLKEDISKDELKTIEMVADNWFKKYNIDIEFTKHFYDRVNDARNGKPISSAELLGLFKKTHSEGSNARENKLIPDDLFMRKLINSKFLPLSAYFKLEKEIDANLQGMYFRAKKEKKPLTDIINNYLNAQNITSEEKKEILNLWRTRIKALSLPKF